MKALRGLLAIAITLLASSFAHSALIDYSITVSGPFLGNGPGGVPSAGHPFGLPLPGDMTTLSAAMTLDNSLGVNDPSALVDFEMATGTRIWTEGDLDPFNTFFALFANGDLQSFGIGFRDASAMAVMSISSVNSWNVVQSPFPGANFDNSRFCNGCVVFEVAPTKSVPEPASGTLLALGGLVLAVQLRSQAKHPS